MTEFIVPFLIIWWLLSTLNESIKAVNQSVKPPPRVPSSRRAYKVGGGNILMAIIWSITWMIIILGVMALL